MEFIDETSHCSDSAMKTYEVSVPFGPVVFESMDSTDWTGLQEPLTIGALTITKSRELTYLASLTVTAESLSRAKDNAVSVVRLLLQVMAVRGDPFVVRFGERVRARRIHEKPTLTDRACSDSDSNVVSAVVEIAAHVTVSSVVTRGNYDLEGMVLASPTSLPNWIATALELNYQAVVNQNRESSLLSSFAALDLITEHVFGTAKALLSVRLDKAVRKEVRKQVTHVLESQGIDGGEIERLLTGLTQTDATPKSERVVTTLAKMGIEAESDEVRRVAITRGSIAHTGSVSDPTDLEFALDRTRHWVQSALNAMLRDRRWLT